MTAGSVARPNVGPAEANRWNLDQLTARVPSALRREPPELDDVIARPRGDHELQEHPYPVLDPLLSKPAAVLLPVVDRPEGATLLLTRRAAEMRSHAAQIAFPGGRIDLTDASPLDAALREAEEEIGLARALVSPLGYLDAYLTGTGYRIVPVVALVQPDFVPVLNPAEVDAVFEVPMAFLMEAANHRREGRTWNGVYRSYYAIPYQDHYIWGATAGMIRHLWERLET
jgi:8-oxo-dGTP pyrophosphatase MutT (NUDIX family)